MKKFRRTAALLLCIALGCTAAGCGKEEAPTVPDENQELVEEEEQKENEGEEFAETAGTLYIGGRTSGFREFPMTFEGEMTPEALIEGIEELTGWKIELADKVTMGKGGMTVCFSEDCALFTGPPEPQKEEFRVSDAGQLAEILLDSIQKTLQMNYTGEGGDPDALDIYYSMEGDEPLVIPGAGLAWEPEQPYSWENAVKTEE